MRLKTWQKWFLGAGCGCSSLLIALTLLLYIPFVQEIISGLASPQRPSDLPPVVTLPVSDATENVPTSQEDAPDLPSSAPTQEKSVFPLNPFSELSDVELSPYPYITGVRQHTREIFDRGQQLGNRPNVFSKVGDSITVTGAFLTPFGRGNYTLGDYAYLQPVIDFYNTETARTSNSFQNESLVTSNGWRAYSVLSPENANPQVCQPGEIPLVCEYRLTRPAVALIMLGTNDVIPSLPHEYEQHMRAILDISIEMGVIPILSTIPEYKQVNLHHEVAQLNEIIIALAREYDVPLWDYHLLLAGLSNQGIGEDGVHPSVSYAHPAEFTSNYLHLGMTVRNLSALQVLDAIYWAIIHPSTE